MAAKAKQADVEEPEEEDRPEGEQPAAKSKFAFLKFKLPALPSTKWMIIGGAGLLVLIGGGGGADFFFTRADDKGARVAPNPVAFVDMTYLPGKLANNAAGGPRY